MLWDVLAGVVIVVLSLWLVATLINAKRSGKEWMTGVLGRGSTLVPNWNFFSPHPGQHDYYFLYRDKRVDGSITPWREIPKFQESPGRLGFLWNPFMTQNKALFDLASYLNKQVEEKNDRLANAEEGLQSIEIGSLQVSVLYLSLLNLVDSQDHPEYSTATQFVIMRHSVVNDERHPMFVSNFHSLDNE